jgi:hypothetical protein
MSRDPKPEAMIEAWKKVHQDNPDAPPEKLLDLIMEEFQKVIDDTKSADSLEEK